MYKKLVLCCLLLSLFVIFTGCVDEYSSKTSSGVTVLKESTSKTTYTKTFLDETIQLKPGEAFTVGYDFSIMDCPVLLKIQIKVLDGPAINFYVTDYENYVKFKSYMESYTNYIDFRYYGAPSGEQIIEKNVEWYAPNKKIYFIIWNKNKYETSTVKIKIVGSIDTDSVSGQ